MGQKSETVFLIITILGLLALAASPKQVLHSRLPSAPSKGQESFRATNTKYAESSQTTNQKELVAIIAVVIVICIGAIFVSLRSSSKLNKKRSLPIELNNPIHPKVILMN